MTKIFTKFILGFLVVLSLVLCATAAEAFPVTFTGTFSETVEDTDTDGLYDELKITAEIDVTEAGQYSISARLKDQQGDRISTDFRIAEYDIGTYNIDLLFSGKEIYFSKTDGPYTLTADLYDYDSQEVESLTDLYTTSSYNYTDFEPIFVENYVITEDIGGYVYERSAYDDEEDYNATEYFAYYDKEEDEYSYTAIVLAFPSDEGLEELFGEIEEEGYELEIISGSLVYVLEDVEDENEVLWFHENLVVRISTDYGEVLDERVIPYPLIEAYLAKHSNDLNEPVTDNYGIPALPDDLTSVTDFYINDATYGKIDFGSQVLDLTDVVDIDNTVLILDNLIGIDTTTYPQLNKPATLTMNGLTFDTPAIYYTNSFTSNPADVTTLCDFCNVVSYADGVLTFTVDHFTTFKAGEAPLLVISDLDVDVDGEKDKNMNDEETISKDAEPGSVVELNIEISNDYDFDLKDVRVEATLRNIGEDSDNLEEESDDFDLDDGEDEDVTLEFDIPLKVEDKDYTITIDVRGKDRNGTRYSTEWTIYLDVKKDKHNIVISEAELHPITVRCEDTVSLDYEITNIGRSREDEVVVEIRNAELGLMLKRTELDLDDDIDEDDNDYSEVVNLDIPSDLAEDVYPIVIRVYYDVDSLSDTKIINIVKEECSVVEEEPEEEVEVITQQTLPPVITEEPEEEVSFEYMLFLVALICVVLGLMFFGIGYLVIKK